MSSTLVDLTAQKDRAIAAAEEIISRAEQQKRTLSHIEDNLVRKHTQEATDLSNEIQRIQSRNPRAEVDALRRATPKTAFIGSVSGNALSEPIAPKRLSADYAPSFWMGYVKSGEMQGASYEGSSTTGLPIVPFVVDQETVPFAPASKAVRRLATVVPTTTDRRLPQVTGLPTAALKAETSAFGVSNSTLGSNTLTANVIGLEWDFSFEILEDTLLLQATALRDAGVAVETLEEQYFLSGTGSGQPQGILGNIDVGVAAATPDGAGNLLSIDATFAVLAALKDDYHDNASWLMQRTTALAIRRAQVQTGSFEKVFVRENGVDLLHGYPVAYSSQIQSVAAGNTPVIFGDFKAGYIIGDRGGSAIRMKRLDQDATKTLEGLVPALIFRRTDGRVRDPHALQAITLHT